MYFKRGRKISPLQKNLGTITMSIRCMIEDLFIIQLITRPFKVFSYYLLQHIVLYFHLSAFGKQGRASHVMTSLFKSLVA